MQVPGGQAAAPIPPGALGLASGRCAAASLPRGTPARVPLLSRGRGVRPCCGPVPSAPDRGLSCPGQRGADMGRRDQPSPLAPPGGPAVQVKAWAEQDQHLAVWPQRHLRQAVVTRSSSSAPDRSARLGSCLRRATRWERPVGRPDLALVPRRCRLASGGPPGVRGPVRGCGPSRGWARGHPGAGPGRARPLRAAPVLHCRPRRGRCVPGGDPASSPAARREWRSRPSRRRLPVPQTGSDAPGCSARRPPGWAGRP